MIEDKWKKEFENLLATNYWCDTYSQIDNAWETYLYACKTREKENAELKELANDINNQARIKGYPTAKEWIELSSKAKKWESEE